MAQSSALELARMLISRPSITPDDAGCQDVLTARLEALGFRVIHLPSRGASNFWARWGRVEPLFVFAGHTDVVPPGPEKLWRSPPFRPEIHDGWLYGRGAADMKGSLASMVTATERFLSCCAAPTGSLAFLVTSAEETMFEDGTPRVLEYLNSSSEKIRWCVIGEPTSDKQVGDTVKNGRRGSLSGRVIVKGKQGHIAYPHHAENAIHRALPALADLIATKWSVDADCQPSGGLQLSRISAGSKAAHNVIPGDCEIEFNIRYNTSSSEKGLREEVTSILNRHRLDYELSWTKIAEPFLTPTGRLLHAVKKAVFRVTGIEPKLSIGGGTSDGRFIASAGAEVVELGLCNKTIHKVNERVAVGDLRRLEDMYLFILMELLT